MAIEATAEGFRSKIETLIINYKKELSSDELRPKVLALIPIVHNLRNLGKALIPALYKSSARDRILEYLLKYPIIIIDTDELFIISGIIDYQKRIRELRVQFGWAIASGITIRQMHTEDPEEVPEDLNGMQSNQYVMLDTVQDRDGAYRWNIANSIRKEKISVRDKIIKFLRANMGRKITGEELRYVTGNDKDWARRTRELRTELGWPIVTKSTGLPDLPVGIYVLQSDRQSPKHDRIISDRIRRNELRRDGYKCTNCGWTHSEWNPSDPRHLEIHHVKHHAAGGKNIEENLTTLCTICHDELHSIE